MDNVKGPPPLSSLLTDTHTAVASVCPSFPQIAHLATPRKKESKATKIYTNKSSVQILSLCNINYIQKLIQYTTLRKLHTTNMQSFQVSNLAYCPTQSKQYKHSHKTTVLPPQGWRCVQDF